MLNEWNDGENEMVRKVHARVHTLSRRHYTLIAFIWNAIRLRIPKEITFHKRTHTTPFDFALWMHSKSQQQNRTFISSTQFSNWNRGKYHIVQCTSTANAIDSFSFFSFIFFLNNRLLCWVPWDVAESHSLAYIGHSLCIHTHTLVSLVPPTVWIKWYLLNI